MSREAENAAFHVLKDRQPIPGIQPFLDELESEVGEQVVTSHQPSVLDIQNLLTSRDAVLPEAFQTVSKPEARPLLHGEEAIKYGLVNNQTGDKFLTALGYAYHEADNRQRRLIEKTFHSEVAVAEQYGQELWRKG